MLFCQKAIGFNWFPTDHVSIISCCITNYPKLNLPKIITKTTTYKAVGHHLGSLADLGLVYLTPTMLIHGKSTGSWKGLTLHLMVR